MVNGISLEDNFNDLLSMLCAKDNNSDSAINLNKKSIEEPLEKNTTNLFEETKEEFNPIDEVELEDLYEFEEPAKPINKDLNVINNKEIIEKILMDMEEVMQDNKFVSDKLKAELSPPTRKSVIKKNNKDIFIQYAMSMGICIDGVVDKKVDRLISIPYAYNSRIQIDISDDDEEEEQEEVSHTATSWLSKRKRRIRLLGS